MHDQPFYGSLALSFVAAFVLVGGEPSQAHSLDDEILICSMMHAKQMPSDFQVEAMKFTGPSGDGRRGSAGFVVQTKKLVKGRGTRLRFVFQRDASGFGFQVIHPFGPGHVLVSIHSGVTIHRGGSWGDIGWGNPGASDNVEMPEDAAELLPLDVGTPHKVVSQLSVQGEYRLWIDDKLVCQHAIANAAPLVLKVPEEQRVWGGSSWDRTPFAGEDFSPNLQPGHAGLILGPMDGSGPKHNSQRISLSPCPTGNAIVAEGNRPAPESQEHFEPLFERIDSAREFGELKRSKNAGGPGGGPFEALPTMPSLLVGFEYSTATFYGGHLTVKSIRPIFRTFDGESLGDWYGVPHGRIRSQKAKDGYVLAGIVAKSGHRVDGMRLVFMRVKNGRLNPDDTYRSKWIGGHGGGAETLYAANGHPVIGVYGRQGHDLDAIGFIQVDETAVK